MVSSNSFSYILKMSAFDRHLISIAGDKHYNLHYLVVGGKALRCVGLTLHVM